MRKIGIMLCITLLVGGMAIQPLQAQGVIRKFKNKVEDAAVDKAVDKVFQTEKAVETPESAQSEKSGSRSGENRPSNTRGEGLTNTAPDVIANIKDAETAYDGKNFTDSRFAVRQAILGIELEIGDKILKGLPETINDLPMIAEEDLVTSSGIGFVGLVIERYYRHKDKELKIMIGNDSGLLAAANMYLVAGGAYGTSSTDQNHKTVKVNEYRGLLEYDEYSGYKLTVPFGQTSLLAVEGINFDNEADIISAAEKIDIDKIKKELGEQ
ncbi:MAG: hypothetical protein IH598_13065 [Bacteroidales bacterium]|nr:hypothetical protein [Bacteroidales bacterium]